MTVKELIDKLNYIEDKSIKIMFMCDNCKKFKDIINMKDFGFICPKKETQND